jgi:hypothetical protein
VEHELRLGSPDVKRVVFGQILRCNFDRTDCGAELVLRCFCRQAVQLAQGSRGGPGAPSCTIGRNRVGVVRRIRETPKSDGVR